MNTIRRAVIIGDHEALSAVHIELSARGDKVVRLEESDLRAERAALAAERAAGDPLDVLVMGWNSPAAGGSAQRALDLIGIAEDFLTEGDGGRVALISGRDYLGWPGRSEIAIDQAGMVGLTRSLALELGARGITINVVCPPTELGPVEASQDPWDAPPPPITGPVGPDDVAFSVAFVTDLASGYLTGQVVHVSGGLSVLSSLSA